MLMQPSVFTKIINGELPCHKVYEDDKTLAFLDIHPVQEGMVVVVPKVQVEEVVGLPDDSYSALMQSVQKVAKKLKEVYPDKKIAFQVEGFDVPHAHVKLFPMSLPADFHAQADSSVEPDHVKLADIAKKLEIK